MGVRTITIRTCDAPRCLRVRGSLTAEEDRGIQEHAEHVEATEYGALFHEGCWLDMSAPELAKALDLDSIEYANRGGAAWEVRR